MMIKKTNRKYYEKPQVSQVKLEIEEAVLAGCKTTTGGGKDMPPAGTKACKLTGQKCLSILGS
ncbi:hypothetical protein KAW18_17470 [candidate division WOR-3 bacterium]|nr:hypothetical protein [candidate division WOR-3 bacterium]